MQITDRVRAALSARYRLQRELGADGMATVFLATDLKHDREVANRPRNRRSIRP